MRLDDRKAARIEFEKVLRTDPNNPLVLDSLAFLFEKEANWKGAVAYRNRLISSSKKGNYSRAVHLYKRAFAKMQLNQLDEALADAKASVALSSSSYEFQALLVQLYKLKGDLAGQNRESIKLKLLESDFLPLR
ncbi:hypothetical protein BH11CYA1_BH11CYA1_33070 [soil metagenome]